MAGSTYSEKICGICNLDCSDQPRLQDDNGVYYHWGCYTHRFGAAEVRPRETAAQVAPTRFTDSTASHSKGRVRKAVWSVALNLATLGLTLFVTVWLMEPPLLVVLGLVFAHLLKACTLGLVFLINSSAPGGAQMLVRWAACPPSEVLKEEWSRVRERPESHNLPFLKHFLISGFVVALVYLLVHETELSLEANSLSWAILLGTVYWLQGLAGRELVFDPAETLAANSYYNEYGMAALLLSVFLVAMPLIAFSGQELEARLPFDPDWIIMGLALFFYHFFSLYREILGPLPVGPLRAFRPGETET